MAVGGTVSHTLTKLKLRATLSDTLLKFVVPVQSVYVRTQSKLLLYYHCWGSECIKYVSSIL